MLNMAQTAALIGLASMTSGFAGQCRPARTIGQSAAQRGEAFCDGARMELAGEIALLGKDAQRGL